MADTAIAPITSSDGPPPGATRRTNKTTGEVQTLQGGQWVTAKTRKNKLTGEVQTFENGEWKSQAQIGLDELTTLRENNNARMKAASRGEPMPPVIAPTGAPQSQSKLSRIGDNVSTGLGDAARLFVKGANEIVGYDQPANKEPSKLFGFEMPDVVAGGANVLNSMGRLVGTGIGAGMDVLASPPGPRLASEVIGEDVLNPLARLAQDATGSKTPIKDAFKAIDTDTRYGEAALNAIPAGGALTKTIGGAIGKIPKSVPRLIKIKDEAYAHPSITAPTLSPQDISSLGNAFDGIQSRTIFSQKLDPDVKNVRVIMDQIVNTGQPVAVEAVEKMRKAINDYAYSPTTTAEEARALLMMREATDNLVQRVNPQAAANLRNGRAASNRLRLVQELIEETQAAKVKGGPLTEKISNSAVLEKELIAEKALREKVGRGFRYTPQMTDKELYRLKSLVQGRTIRNTASVIGKIAAAPTLVRGLALAAAGGTGFAFGGPIGAGVAIGGLLGAGITGKGIARVGTGRAINALDRAYRQFTPEQVPRGNPTINTPNITPLTPRPAPPAPAATPQPAPPPPVGPAPVGPAPVGPAPVGPAPVGPAPVGPAPVGPAPVGPAPVGPVAAPPPGAPTAKSMRANAIIARYDQGHKTEILRALPAEIRNSPELAALNARLQAFKDGFAIGPDPMRVRTGPTDRGSQIAGIEYIIQAQKAIDDWVKDKIRAYVQNK